MKKLIKILIIFLIIVILFGIFYINNFNNSILFKFDKTEINNSIVSSQIWLINYQKRDGLYHYEYFPKNNSFLNDNNMVRQIGAFYFLIKTSKFNNNFKLNQSIFKFKSELTKNYLKYNYINKTKIAYIEYKNFSKINSNALYILALIEMKKNGYNLSKKDLLDLKYLVNGIKLMHSNSGGFYYIYYLDKKYNKITPYGSGESFFALMSYYNYIDNDEKLLIFLKLNFEKLYYKYISENFNGENLRSFYSWSLYFLNEYNLNKNISYDKNFVPEYFATNLIKKAIDFKNNNYCKNQGCIMSNNIGDVTFLEGTSIGYNLIKNNSNLKFLVDKYFNKAYPFFLSLQVTDDETNFFNNKTLTLGGFCNDYSCSIMRIDYNQHATSSLINLYNLY